MGGTQHAKENFGILRGVTEVGRSLSISYLAAMKHVCAALPRALNLHASSSDAGQGRINH